MRVYLATPGQDLVGPYGTESEAMIMQKVFGLLGWEIVTITDDEEDDCED